MRSTSTLPTILQQYCGSRPTSPVQFGIKMQSPSSQPRNPSSHESDYFSSHLNTQDLLDSLPKLSKSTMVEGEELELERIRNGLLQQAPGKEGNVGKARRPSASYFRIVKNQGVDIASSTSGGSSLSTPSLESDYSLSASCSPLHTPLDDYEYSGPATPLDSNSPVLEPASLPSLATRRGRPMKIDIPAFQLDASYFTAPPKAAVAKPSSFQFDVAPPRRSKPSNTSTSLPAKPSAPSSWSQDPVDLAGIIGERPGSPIRFKTKRRDNGFAF